MSRTGCFGTCPAYSVEVDVSGHVTYRGESFVLTGGTATAQLRPEALRDLRLAIAEARFETIPTECGPAATDNPGANITVADGHEPRTVWDDAGCLVRTKTLVRLEHEIDRIVGTETWTGSPAEREECFADRRSACSFGVRTLGEGHCSVLRGLFTQSSEEMMPPSPWPGTLVDDSGKVGFLVSTILPESPYARCGFENGDVWTQINGVPLTSTDAAARAFKLINEAPSLVVMLLRRGQPMTIRVDLR